MKRISPFCFSLQVFSLHLIQLGRTQSLFPPCFKFTISLFFMANFPFGEENRKAETKIVSSLGSRIGVLVSIRLVPLTLFHTYRSSCHLFFGPTLIFLFRIILFPFPFSLPSCVVSFNRLRCKYRVFAWLSCISIIM
jgi:hypothetical protein